MTLMEYYKSKLTDLEALEDTIATRKGELVVFQEHLKKLKPEADYQKLLCAYDQPANLKTWSPLIATLSKLKGLQPPLEVGECFKPPAKR